MMKGKSVLILATMAATCIPAYAVELDADVSADFVSRYVWRGQSLEHKGSLQPAATIGKNGWSFNVWGTMPLDSTPGGTNATQHNFNEVDYTLDYSGEYESFGYSAGFILYTFPTSAGVASGARASSTQELYAGATYDTFLSPTITAYHTTNLFHGWYINASVSHSVDVTDVADIPIAVDLSASLGWGDKKYNNAYWVGGTTTPGEGLNDFVFTAAIPVEVAENVTVSSYVSFITLVDDGVRSANGFSGKGDFVVGGVGVAAAF